MSLARDLPGDHRVALALKFQLPSRCVGKLLLNLRERFLRNQDFTRRGGALESRRDVDRVAEHGVVGYIFAADVADESCAGADADANLQPVFLSHGCDLTDNFHCGCHRAFWVIMPMQRRAKERHHFIADELVERAIVAKDRVAGDLIESIESHGDFRGIHLFHQRGEAADVDEHDRDVFGLPARGSELVSKRAEMGILPRRAYLEQLVG